MTLWKIHSMEDDYPGLWQQWYRHQCVAVVWIGGWSEIRLLYPSEDQFGLTTRLLKESLEWVGEQLGRKDDHVGAAEAALVHRHLFRDELGTTLYQIQSALNERLGKKGYVYAGVDYLEQVIRGMLEKSGNAKANSDVPVSSRSQKPPTKKSWKQKRAAGAQKNQGMKKPKKR